MAHLKKNVMSSVGHLFNHYARRPDDGVERSNECIENDKTHLNYNLAPEVNGETQLDRLHKRLGEVKVHKRANVNVLCSWVVTAPKDLNPLIGDEFFKETYNFLNSRYGEKNVVSSYVHMDETTPHMHYAFVPVTIDKKKGFEKVSAKEVITRDDLRSFHQNLERHLIENNIECSILSDIVKEGNKSIEELKRGTAIERMQEIEFEIDRMISQTREGVKIEESKLKSLQAEYESKKAYVEGIKEAAKINEMYPSEVERIQKGFFKNKKDYVLVPKDVWEGRYHTVNEKYALNEQQKIIDNKLEDIQDIPNETRKTQEQNLYLYKENERLKQREIEDTRKYNNMKEALETVGKKHPEFYKEVIDIIQKDMINNKRIKYIDNGMTL